MCPDHVCVSVSTAGRILYVCCACPVRAFVGDRVCPSGAITVELEDGSLGAPSGSILNDASQFVGKFSLVSSTGDIDLTFLPSAI